VNFGGRNIRSGQAKNNVAPQVAASAGEPAMLMVEEKEAGSLAQPAGKLQR